MSATITTCRPNARCFYCGAEEALQEDHVVPFSRGGSSLPRNLVFACTDCNMAKSDRLPSEWRSDLGARVYELERDLVAWHEQVDTRGARGRTSIAVGMWIRFTRREPKTATRVAKRCTGRIEAMDGKGLRIVLFNAPPMTGSPAEMERKSFLPEQRERYQASSLELVVDSAAASRLADEIAPAASAVWLPWADIEDVVVAPEVSAGLLEDLYFYRLPSKWEIRHKDE